MAEITTSSLVRLGADLQQSAPVGATKLNLALLKRMTRPFSQKCLGTRLRVTINRIVVICRDGCLFPLQLMYPQLSVV